MLLTRLGELSGQIDSLVALICLCLLRRLHDGDQGLFNVKASGKVPFMDAGPCILSKVACFSSWGNTLRDWLKPTSLRSWRCRAGPYKMVLSPTRQSLACHGSSWLSGLDVVLWGRAVRYVCFATPLAGYAVIIRGPETSRSALLKHVLGGIQSLENSCKQVWRTCCLKDSEEGWFQQCGERHTKTGGCSGNMFDGDHYCGAHRRHSVSNSVPVLGT